MNRTTLTGLTVGALLASGAATVSAPATADDSERGSPPKVFFEGCGALQIGPQGCIVFDSDAAGAFAIGNAGGFAPGERAFVSGVVDFDSLLCFPAPVAGIDDNFIGPCKVVCGRIVPGPQGCVGISTGDEFFVLEATGGIDADLFDELVRASGLFNPESGACFPVAPLAAIERATLSMCTDLNGDRQTGSADLAILLGAWETDDPLVDMDNDGLVGSRDLAILLGQWDE